MKEQATGHSFKKFLRLLLNQKSIKLSLRFRLTWLGTPSSEVHFSRGESWSGSFPFPDMSSRGNDALPCCERLFVFSVDSGDAIDSVRLSKEPWNMESPVSCLRPGYFLLQSSDYMMRPAFCWLGWGSMNLGDPPPPVKAFRGGSGLCVKVRALDPV